MAGFRLPAEAPLSLPGTLRWVAVLIVATALGGAIASLAAPGSPFILGLLAAAILLAAMASALALQYPQAVSTRRPGILRGARRALHAAGFAGGAAFLGSVVVDGFAVAQRLGVLDLRSIAGAVVPGVAAYAGVCLAAAAVILALSLRVPAPPPTSAQRVAAHVAILASVAGLGLARAILGGLLPPVGGRPLAPLDAVFALNFAAGAAIAAALLARRVPSPFFPPMRADGSRAFAYIALAGVLVAVMALVALGAAGLGSPGQAGRVAPALALIVMAFVMLATGASAIQARAARPDPLYVQRMAPERRRRWMLLGAGIGMGVPVAVVGALVSAGRIAGIASEHGLEVLLVAPLVAIAPLAFYDHTSERRRIRLEDRFPDLLRDLAASVRAGLTLPKASIAASRGNYDALQPEVRGMAAQVSWGMPFEDALERMAGRVNTLGVRVASAVVHEASASGGDAHDVLRVVGDQRRDARELEAERRSGMGLYVVVVYVAFFVFMSILLILAATFLPALARAGSAAVSSGASSLGFVNINLIEFRRLFLAAAFVQGVGDGIVAGVLTTGRLQSGLKHAVILGVLGVATMAMFAPL